MNISKMDQDIKQKKTALQSSIWQKRSVLKAVKILQVVLHKVIRTITIADPS